MQIKRLESLCPNFKNTDKITQVINTACPKSHQVSERCHSTEARYAILLQWFSSVQSLSQVRLFVTPWTTTRLPCPSPTPRAYSNSCPSSSWCHPTISSSVIPFSSHLQSFPALGAFPMSWLFTSGGQSIAGSTLALVHSVNILGWFPLGLTGLISLLSKGLLRVFSSTTVQKHQFFCAQPSLWSNTLLRKYKLGIQK